MKALLPVLLLVASCAASAPTVNTPAPAPAADPWADTDGTMSRFMRRLAEDLDCEDAKKGLAPFCRIGAGWDGAAPFEVPEGEHVLAGITIALAAGEDTSNAFKRPLLLSAMAVTHDQDGVRVRLVIERPTTSAETSEAVDAIGWFAAYLNGEAPGMRVTGGLAGQLEALRQRADQPTELTPHGLRFTLPDGTRAAFRRVGDVFVVVEHPAGIDGVIVTLLTEKLKLEPTAAPGSPP